MKQFPNNRALFDYLVSLALELKERKLDVLSEIVTFAGQHASGMSTEFLGESRIALRRVLDEERGALTFEEREDLSDVIKQLDHAFSNRA